MHAQSVCSGSKHDTNCSVWKRETRATSSRRPRRKELTEMSSTYTEAKVEQEEDVECHVNLQREVFVEVLTGLDGTVRQRQKQKMLMSKGRYWQWSVKTQGHFFEIKMFHENENIKDAFFFSWKCIFKISKKKRKISAQKSAIVSVFQCFFLLRKGMHLLSHKQ